MSKYDWQLLINLKEKPKNKPDYEKSYIFNRSDLKICLYKDGVCVHWYKTSDENGWDPDSALGRKYFNDALRKANLLYALQYGKGLEIKKFTIRCGKVVHTIEEKDSQSFPYICSMMQGVDYAAEANENDYCGIFGNIAVMDHIALGKWSVDQSDEKMVALYAYLQSRGRYYEVDRFLNLWTSINAVYCHISNEHRKDILRKTEAVSDEELSPLVADEESIKKELKKFMSDEGLSDKTAAKTLLARKKMITAYTAAERADGEQKSYLLRLAHEMKGISYRSKRDRWTKLEQFDTNVHKDFYSLFVERHKLKDGRIKYTSQNLYEKVMGGQPEEWDDRKEELYRELMSHINELGITSFSFFTFDMPYMERNKLIHGSEATLLLADYYQINRIACLNYFMDLFLEEFIPYLFDDEKMKQIIPVINGYIFERRRQDPDTSKTIKVLKRIIPAEKRREEKWLEGKWE